MLTNVIIFWDWLSAGTSCPLGRVVRWDGLSIGTSCPLGRAVHWDVLSVGTGCPLGRVVLGWAVLEWVVRWDGLSAGTGCPLGRVVLEPTNTRTMTSIFPLYFSADFVRLPLPQGGEPVPESSDGRLFPNFYETKRRHVPRLFLVNLREGDSGNYSCVADNPHFGEITIQTFVLSVSSE